MPGNVSSSINGADAVERNLPLQSRLGVLLDEIDRRVARLLEIEDGVWIGVARLGELRRVVELTQGRVGLAE